MTKGLELAGPLSMKHIVMYPTEGSVAVSLCPEEARKGNLPAWFPAWRILRTQTGGSQGSESPQAADSSDDSQNHRAHRSLILLRGGRCHGGRLLRR